MLDTDRKNHAKITEQIQALLKGIAGTRIKMNEDTDKEPYIQFFERMIDTYKKEAIILEDALDAIYMQGSRDTDSISEYETNLSDIVNNFMMITLHILNKIRNRKGFNIHKSHVVVPE